MKKTSLFVVGVSVVLSACAGSDFFPESLTSSSSNLSSDKRQESEFLLDDMVLENSLITHFPSEKEVHSLAAGGYSVYDSRVWKNGIVPVAFDASVSRQSRLWFMDKAQHWARGTGVWFINRTDQTEYVLVTTSGNGCYANVGASKNSVRSLNLARACWTERVLLHELGHVLGLMHEHQRPNRIHYININLENVAPENQYAFKLFSKENYSEAYDFMSIMHYDQYAFSKNGKPSITTVSTFSNYQSLMGKNGISDGDRRVIKALYDSSKKDQYAGFSESYYRNQYPDVADAIARGRQRSGRDHYLRTGCREGRNPNMDFNEMVYRQQNPDVAKAIANGGFNRCGFLHFSIYGRAEGRRAVYVQ